MSDGDYTRHIMALVSEGERLRVFEMADRLGKTRTEMTGALVGFALVHFEHMERNGAFERGDLTGAHYALHSADELL